MTQKIATITIKDLDITQLVKCANAFRGTATMDPSGVNGAYNKELYALILQIVEAGYEGQREIRAVDLTI
jgi:hypothetical protein